MKISEILDGLKLDPTRIATVPTKTQAFEYYPRALFWHPARKRFAIYELSLGYSSISLHEKSEIYITEMANEEWLFADFNDWQENESERLRKEEEERRAAQAEKKKVEAL